MLDTLVTVWISRAALDAIVTEAERVTPLETGGVLLGYSGGSADIVVTKSVGPGPKATHAETRFLPDADYHESAVAAAYAASRRRHVYLGDWHTHPGGGLELSMLDRRVLRRIAEAKEARMPHPIMAVLGGKTKWELGIWRYLAARFVSRIMRRDIARCEIRLYEDDPGGAKWRTAERIGL